LFVGDRDRFELPRRANVVFGPIGPHRSKTIKEIERKGGRRQSGTRAVGMFLTSKPMARIHRVASCRPRAEESPARVAFSFTSQSQTPEASPETHPAPDVLARQTASQPNPRSSPSNFSLFALVAQPARLNSRTDSGVLPASLQSQFSLRHSTDFSKDPTPPNILARRIARESQPHADLGRLPSRWLRRPSNSCKRSHTLASPTGPP
jgi:hypothetical protein